MEPLDEGTIWPFRHNLGIFYSLFFDNTWTKEKYDPSCFIPEVKLDMLNQYDFIRNITYILYNNRK